MDLKYFKRRYLIRSLRLPFKDESRGNGITHFIEMKIRYYISQKCVKMYDLRGPLTATQLVNGKTGNPALVSRFQSQCLSTVPHYVAFPKSNTGLGRWLGLLEHENGQFF